LLFFIGLHQPAHARRFERCLLSVNRIRERRSNFDVADWILDSGAFTEVTTHGGYRRPVSEHARQIDRWSKCGRLLRAVQEDYMCEPFVLKRTGKTLREHQLLTVERYMELVRLGPAVQVMPVLQGYAPSDYVRHVIDFGHLLEHGAWVGVGSVCKRNGTPAQVEDVLIAIYRARPDLRLHGFGVKFTALASDVVRSLLYSADSMAWSFRARIKGRDGNDPLEAEAYVRQVETQTAQKSLFHPDEFRH
jgi:hypothetical protein